MPLRTRLAATALFLLATPLGAHAASFTVVDDKAAEEIAETTRLYIDGKLAAQFRLDDVHTHKEIRVDAPDRPGQTAHDYALCGQISYVAADGARQTRQVSGGGTLPAPDGMRFIAVGAADFTLFFLVDPADRMASRPKPGPSPFCEAPIS
ncbi:hypothetical protein NFI95_05250 [Acetobacteraceae bacterium KSS8]|uniref:Uncharacterized protein n=1 Tax=Endosaccharibacter trunci TaxID=2812733 RepID=A0ABT1W4P9_9PROT|nr:hypothetical protein [Acetobacteraceae bacterium KSS8]